MYGHHPRSRHDSGIAFENVCFTTPDFSSDSESISPSSPNSFASTSSSLASSPALLPAFLNNHPEPLSLSHTKPSPDQLSSYAADIIRNEAYALLALASRIAPASAQDHYEMADSIDEMDGYRLESRSNVEFRRCVEMLAALPPHGKIIVTGVGKSGIAGRKLVATFCSLGKLSCLPDPSSR